MGCFLACFGVSNNRKKRRKQRKRFLLLRDNIHGSYQPLDSFVPGEANAISANTSTSLISGNSVTAKVKKKVRFDLNVRTYEPIPTEESDPHSAKISDTELDTEGEICAETSRVDPPPSDCEGVAVIPRGTLPLSYRYHNCRDIYEEVEEEEEDDEFLFEDSDFDYENGGDLDSFDDLEDDTCTGDLSEEDSSEEEEAPLIGSRSIQEQNSSYENPRLRSRFSESVLNPIENLTQWKAIKAKEAPPKSRSKENIASKKEARVPFTKTKSTVNTSLSNWLPMSGTDTSEAIYNDNLNPLFIKNSLTRQGMSC